MRHFNQFPSILPTYVSAPKDHEQETYNSNTVNGVSIFESFTSSITNTVKAVYFFNRRNAKVEDEQMRLMPDESKLFSQSSPYPSYRWGKNRPQMENLETKY